MTTRKCSQCKRTLPEIAFFYREKDHSTCQPCAERRQNRKNVCRVCGRNAIYNLPDQEGGIRCKEHIEPGMIDVKSKRCRCGKKRPTFNYAGEDQAICCAQCKDPGMIDVKNKRCRCGKKRPVFNYTGEDQAICCAECKDPGMIDVKHKRCRCGKKRPTFNYTGEDQAICCAECKDPGMIDVKNRKCRCGKKRPVFNYTGEDQAICCAECKDPGMIDVKHKRCRCGKKRPNFNYAGEDQLICCAQCKDPGMIDVKNKRCTQPDCKTRANYGVPHNQPTRCAQHRENGMIIRPRAKCRKRGCSEIAQYGTDKPIHCESHRNGNDIDLCQRRCQKCGQLDILLNGVCVNFCLREEEYAQIYRKNQKQRENRTAQVLAANFEPPHHRDRRLEFSSDCQEYARPDFIWDYGSHIIVLECDESQHSDRCFEGEQNRMVAVYMTLGGIPTTFIRYNPDSYKPKNERKLTLQQREDVLVRWLKKIKADGSTEPLRVIYLFYDGYNTAATTLHRINPYERSRYHFNNRVYHYRGVLNAFIAMAPTTDKPALIFVDEENEEKQSNTV